MLGAELGYRMGVCMQLGIPRNALGLLRQVGHEYYILYMSMYSHSDLLSAHKLWAIDRTGVTRGLCAEEITPVSKGAVE